MTNTVSLISELPIEALHMQSIVLLHKIDADSDHLTSNISSGWYAMNDAACLSTTLVSENSNNTIAAKNLDVQVLAAMKKA